MKAEQRQKEKKERKKEGRKEEKRYQEPGTSRTKKENKKESRRMMRDQRVLSLSVASEPKSVSMLYCCGHIHPCSL